MKNAVFTENQQVEQSEKTSVKANELNQETPKELDIDVTIKKWEMSSNFNKEYSIPAYEEEPSCEILECIAKSIYNKVIIVDASFQYVEKVCKYFYRHFQASISFTFYLGSSDPKVIKYWEPEKASYWRTLEAIKLANAYGFEVKVICNPLDMDTYSLVQTLTPFVDEIYIDIASDINNLVTEDDHENFDKVIKANELINNQTDDWVLSLVEKLNNNPIVKWGVYIDRIRRSNMFLV
jgi:hypothetical protein